MNKTACVNKKVYVKKHQLPICCPQPGEEIFNAHPKIYLSLDEKNREATCPYCSTVYVLVDE